MNTLIKFIFSKKYREEMRIIFSHQIIEKMNNSEIEIEMIYKELFDNNQVIAA